MMHSIHKESTTNKNSKKEKKFYAQPMSEQYLSNKESDKSTLTHMFALLGIVSWLGLNWHFSAFPKHISISCVIIIVALVMLRSAAPDNSDGKLN